MEPVTNTSATDVARMGGVSIFFRCSRWIFLMLLLAVGPLSIPASAVTAEVAKKCKLLVAKAYPPTQPGNPAAGNTRGKVEGARDYFKKCVDNGGNLQDGNH